MAIRIGAIEVVLRTELDQFTGGMRRAASEVDQQGSRITRATGSMAAGVTDLERRFRSFDGGVAFRGLELSALRASNQVDRLRNIMLLLPAAVGGTAAALGARQLTDLADEATKVRNRINTVIEGTSQRVAAEEQVFNIAQRTRQEYGATAQLFARTTQAARGLGRSQGEVLQFVEAVQKTNLISGATTQEASAAATQLAQGLASNRLQGDELRSILENNVALSQILAQELAGGSTGRLREMGSNGELTAQAVMDAVLRRQDEINQRFAQSSPLIAQGLTYLNNALIRYVGIIDQATGASERMGEFFRWLGDNIPGIASAVIGLGVALTALTALRLVRGGAGGFFGNIREEVGKAREMAALQRDAANAQMVAAKQNQAEARKQVQAAAQAVQAAYATPILANANPQAVQRLSAAEEAYARAKRNLADIDARIASNEDARSRVAGQVAVQRERFLNRELDAVRRVAEAENAAVPAAQRLAAARAALDQGQGALAGLERGVANNERAGRAGLANAGRELIEAQREENARRLQALQIAEREYQEKAARIQQQEGRLAAVRAGGSLDVEGQQRRIDEKVSTLDRQRAALEAARLQATNAAATTSAGVAAARSGVEASAEQRIADLKNVSAAASTRLSEANAQVAATSAAAANSQRTFASTMATLNTVKVGLLATGSSLAAFLGGPWGVAFAVASAALGVFAYRQAQAAEEAGRHKRALEGLPEAIRAVEEARQAAAQGRSQPQAEVAGRASLAASVEAQRAQSGAMFEDLQSRFGSRGRYNLFREAGVLGNAPEMPERFTSLQAARQFERDSQQAFDTLRRIGVEGRGSAEEIQKLMDVVTRRSVAGLLDPQVAKTITDNLSKLREQAANIDNLRGGIRPLSASNALNEVAADNPAAVAARVEREALIRRYEAAITSAKATAEAAAPAFKALSEEVTKPLTEGATGFDLAQRTGISEQAKTAVQEYAAAMGQLRLAAAALPDGPLRNYVQAFTAGATPLAEFKARLEEIQRTNPDLGGVVRGLTDTAQSAGTSRDRVDALQRAINALTGKTIDILLRISQINAGAPEAGEADGLARGLPTATGNANLARIQARDRVEEELRRSRQSKREYGIEDLARRLGVPTSDPRLGEIFDNNDTSRGGGAGARDAKQYAKTLRELREEASSFSLSDIDRETVRYSRTAKVAEADVRAFIEAMAAGRTNDIPPRIRAIREELEKLNGLRLRKEFTDKFATDDERYAKELQRLQQAGFDDATFQQMRGRLSRSIFGDPGGDLAKGFTDMLKSAVSGDWDGALKGFGKRFLNIMVDAVFKPVEKQLAELFRSLFEGILGQGGGNGGSLFSGLFTGLQGLFGLGGGGGSTMTSILHGGGIVGSAGATGVAPASLWNSAPRYHSGLRTGEIRAVLQRGEQVLTQADSERNLRLMGGLARAAGGGGGVGRLQVNVHNYGNAQVETQDNGDGSVDVIVESLESRLAGRAARREGSLYEAMGQTLNTPGNGGLRGL